MLHPILSITGSDSTGGAGIQADIRTISSLGGYAVTAITSITVQDKRGIQNIHDMPASLVVEQVISAFNDAHPKAVKVGMLRDVDTIRMVGEEIVRCKNVVLDPGIITSHGTRLLSDEAMLAWKRFLIPRASILLISCAGAEALLCKKINTDDDMLKAAKQLCEMGAEYVMLRGGHITEGQLTALLYSEEAHYFVSSHNTDGWQKHGVGGALSSAIATRLAMGDGMTDAISNAHAYMHSQVVYAVSTDDEHRLRSADLYNQFMSLIADNYREAHNVKFYADKLCITTRYLSQITDKVVGKSPKELIAEYLVNEALTLIETTRLNIQEISVMLGFSSQAMFSQFFRNHKGYTPSEIRNKKKLNEDVRVHQYFLDMMEGKV